MINRLFILFALALIPCVSHSQKLVDNIKKKYYGVYEGTVPGFDYNTGSDLIRVEPAMIRITLSENAIVLHLGNLKRSGIYTVLFRGDGYYVLDARFEGQQENERIVVHERGKTITREGLFPQPNASLEKLSKKAEKALKSQP